MDIDSIPEIQVTNKFGNLDVLFGAADRNKDGRIDPQEAKDFFPQFGLPNQFLSNVWRNCVNDPSGMERHEFIRAMKFVYAETERMQPMTPRGFNMSPMMPMMGAPSPVPFGAPMMGIADGSGINFAMSPQERSNYEGHFHKLAGNQGTISGNDARSFFLQSKLDSATLKQIWQLADMEKRGYLDKDEFCVAMHLIRLKVKNHNMPIPPQLPPVLAPPGKMIPMGVPGFASDMMPYAMSTATPQSIPGSGFASTVGSARGTPSPSPSHLIPAQRTGSTYGSTQSHTVSIEQNNALIKSAQTLHDSVQKLLNETKNLTTETFTTQNQVIDRKEKLEQMKQEETALKQRSEQLKHQLDQSREDRVHLETELSGYTSRVEMLTHEKEMFEHELGELTREIERLNDIKNHGHDSTSNLSKEVEELEEQVRYNQQRLAEQRNEIVQCKRSHDVNIRRREELALEVKQIKQQFEAAQEDLKNTKSEVDDIGNKIAYFECTKNEYVKAIEQSQSQTKEVEQKKHDLSQQLDSCKKELAELEKQFSSAGNRAKQARLISIIETTTEFLNEFSQLMKEQKEDIAKAPSVRHYASSNAPASGNASADFALSSEFDKHFDGFEKSTALGPAPAANNFGFDDFAGFGEPTTAAAPDKLSSLNRNLESTRATLNTNGFEDSFGDDAFVIPAPSALQIPPPIPTTSASTQKQPTFNDTFEDAFGPSNDDNSWDNAAFEEFKDNNSSMTKPTGLGDFGFDDNFEKPAEDQPKPATNFDDDWANFH